MQDVTIPLCVHDKETYVHDMRTVFMSMVHRQCPPTAGNVSVHDMWTVSTTQRQCGCLSGVDSVRLLWTATYKGGIKKLPRAHIKRVRKNTRPPAIGAAGSAVSMGHGHFSLLKCPPLAHTSAPGTVHQSRTPSVSTRGAHFSSLKW